MFYPLRIYEGRDGFFVSMTYTVASDSETKCHGWGIVSSDMLFSLGDRFMCNRFLSNELGGKVQEYYFIDFSCDKKRIINNKRLLKSSLDIRKKSWENDSIPLVILNNKKDDLIIGIGRIDFLRRKVELEMLEALPVKILSFFG